MPPKKTKLTPEPRRLALGSLRYHLHEAGLPTHNATPNVLWTVYATQEGEQVNIFAAEIEQISPCALIIRRGKVTTE